MVHFGSCSSKLLSLFSTTVTTVSGKEAATQFTACKPDLSLIFILEDTEPVGTFGRDLDNTKG